MNDYLRKYYGNSCKSNLKPHIIIIHYKLESFNYVDISY